MTIQSSKLIIEARGLTKRYGGLIAIDSIDLTFREGEITGVIGPNGAGKSTLIGLLGGALTPTSGQVLFEGKDISAIPASERARAGIGRTYQLPRPFLNMTVRENLQVAQFSRTPWMPTHVARAETDNILDRCGLGDVANIQARNLPLLRRKRLELARALMLNPRVLMLDEVGAGLVDHEISELISLIRDLHNEQMSIIIVEHVIQIVRACCKSLYVLNFGRKFAEGETSDILASDDVAAVYLGTAHHVNHVDSEVKPRTQLLNRAMFRREDQHGNCVEPLAKSLLKIDGISAGYGQAKVLKEISIDIAAGEVVAILGSNGAGKTTLANVIAGSLVPTAGQITLDGKDITRAPAYQRFGMGLAHCMEGRRIFAELSVEENLRIAIRGTSRTEIESRIEDVYTLFPVIKERRRHPGTSLSGGQLQMLAIARALVSHPRLVIFDEISLGLAPIVMDQLYQALVKLKERGLTMIVVEQDVERALELADNVHVLQQGRILLSGSTTRVGSDRQLRDLYLGASGH